MGKFDIVSKTFYVTNECNNQICHNILNFDKLKDLIKNSKINLIDFNEKIILYLLVVFLFHENKNYENINIKTDFLKYSKSEFLWTNKEIYFIKKKFMSKWKISI